MPYLTHPANVAILLAHYGCDDDTILAGILHDVVEDCEEPGHTREIHLRQIRDKFSAEVEAAVDPVTHRQRATDGSRLTWEERMDAYLRRLGEADDRARWICAADKPHSCRGTLSGLSRAEDRGAFWSRFGKGREETIAWYRRVHDRLLDVGFGAPIMDELLAAVQDLERAAGGPDLSPRSAPPRKVTT